jgi:hypothetical protein
MVTLMSGELMPDERVLLRADMVAAGVAVKITFVSFAVILVAGKYYDFVALAPHDSNTDKYTCLPR